MKTIKENLIVAIILIVIISITFYKLLNGQYILASSDTLSPLAIKNGIQNSYMQFSTYPLWLPWILSGMPTIHSFLDVSQHYYPHYLISYFLNNFGIPWIWNFLIHFIFGGIGMYNLLRYFSTHRFASIISALSFMLMPYMIAMTVHGHGGQMMTACYIPWTILFLFKIYNNQSLYNFSIFSLFLGLQLQRGHIQIAYYTWMMIGLFVLIKSITLLKGKYINLKAIYLKYAIIFSSLAMGLLLSLNLYIPVLNYSPHSIRSAQDGGSGLIYATQWSFSFQEAITFIIPSFLGFGGELYWGGMPFTDYPNYIGLLLIIFAVIGVVKTKVDSDIKLFLLLVIIFSFFLSLGKNFIFLYEIFYKWFPYFNKFRSPVFILILLNFCVYIFTGFGLHYIIASLKRKCINKTILIPFIISFIIFIIFYLVSDQIIPNNNLSYLIKNDFLNIIICLSCIMVFLFLSYKYQLEYKYFLIIVLLVIVYDFTRINHEIISPSLHQPNKQILHKKEYLDKYLTQDTMVNYILNDSSKFRIFDLAGNQNRWAVFNIENVNGYHPAKLSSYSRLIKLINNSSHTLWPPGILKLLNVKYILLPNSDYENPLFTRVASKSMYYFGYNNKYDGRLINMDIYEFNDFVPRISFVNSLKNIDNKYILSQVINKDFDPTKKSYFSNNDKLSDYEFNTRDAKVSITKWEPNLIEFNTECNTEQFIILSEIYYPDGWVLTDGITNYEIYEVNSLIRGFFVPRGKKYFTMKFDPKDVKIGTLISYFVLIVLLLSLVCNIYFNVNKDA